MTKWLVVLALLGLSSSAQAFTLSGFAGSHLGSDERGMFGGELTFSAIPTINLGLFYEYSHRQASLEHSESVRNAFGAVGRFSLPLLDFFADVRGGYHHTTDPAVSTSLDGVYVDGGIGYSLSPIPFLQIQPRFGLLLVGTNSTYPTVDASIMLSVGF